MDLDFQFSLSFLNQLTSDFIINQKYTKNLYFVGAGTHPGAGMPGVLSSAKVLDRLL